ncbi:zf-RING_2 domain-containing protein [Cephalotus follicularis]|uniref:RING-type E3 ubiquitin transferase n=1 Tax=Cephalotus follicularis TaxID=3775 RepID=A0A1Q3B568_CEPFO|nr:zf-RING_2 domain-containing protein [Cephalotus follicularis]
MAIIIVVLIAALFFMGFFSVYIRHCSDAHTASSGSLLPRPTAGRRVDRGLDPELIATFPTLNYSVVKGLKIGKGALECAVCLTEFEDDETLRLIPNCDHVFHPECIDEWLSLHTTCPVCRANLVPQPGESTPQLAPLTPHALHIDVDNNNMALENVNDVCVDVQTPPAVMSMDQTPKNRTRGSRSGRPRKFPRSHSTGHSLVQPGESTDRFTLRLPDEVSKQVMIMNRANSMVVLPMERGSRRGYRTGEGSSRGKSYRRLEKLDPVGNTDRWVFSMAPPFFSRTSSLTSPRVTVNNGEASSVRSNGPELSSVDSSRPPV